MEISCKLIALLDLFIFFPSIYVYPSLKAKLLISMLDCPFTVFWLMAFPYRCWRNMRRTKINIYDISFVTSNGPLRDKRKELLEILIVYGSLQLDLDYLFFLELVSSCQNRDRVYEKLMKGSVFV